jgi:16S rRNA (guanine966-N2)-methyltransferase
MRVIAGSAGGLRLIVPETGVRPTMDRVKAAIFSSLGERVAGARVLDLFAGAGGLGIEALSRGASEAVFVEKDREAIRCIEDNLRHTKMEERGRIVNRDAHEFLRQSEGREKPFDVIFADPPYARKKGDFNHGFTLVKSAEIAAMLAPTGLFVLEIMPGEKLPETPHFTVVRSRRYGKTETVFLEHAHS